MKAVGIPGMSPGTMGIIFAISALSKVANLEKILKDKEFQSEDYIPNDNPHIASID